MDTDITNISKITFKMIIAKSYHRSMMILSEFYTKVRDYSFTLGIYNFAWWIGWYLRPLRFLYNWSNPKIEKWIGNYITKNYRAIVDAYSSQDYIIQQNSQLNIYVFWFQGIDQMPELVLCCYKQLIKNNLNVVFIDKNNLHEYLNNSTDLICKVESGKLKPAHLSDLLRQTLLAERGGIWVDATCYIPYKIPLSIFNYKFYSPHSNIADSRWVSWCLATNYVCNPLFSFVRDILCEIAKNKNSFPHYLFQDYLMLFAYNNFPIIKDMVDACPANNTERNSLHFRLNKEFIEKDFQVLISNNWIFKLSYKTPWQKMTANDHFTYYGKITAEQLNN